MSDWQVWYFLRVILKNLLSFSMAAITGFLAALALRVRKALRTQTGWPVNLAHRGSSASVPENTLEAFQLAIEEGAGGLELDVHMSRDGNIVVIHDEVVDRTTNGHGLVRDKLFSEIKALDAGYRFSYGGDSGFPYRGRGLGVPTLEEVYRQFPGVTMNVDIKEDAPGIEEAVLRVVEKAGAEGRTLVASQKHRRNKRFRRVSKGKIPTSASKFEIGLFYLFSRLWIERLLRPSYAAIQVPTSHLGIEILTPRFVAAAHDRGLRVDVWTVDEPDEMDRLLDLGVDVIMTNRPRVLAGVLKERASTP